MDWGDVCLVLKGFDLLVTPPDFLKAKEISAHLQEAQDTFVFVFSRVNS